VRRALRLAPVVAALVVAVAAGCGGVGHTEAGSAGAGEDLFNEHCASCHALAAAGAQGQVGPDLDAAFAGPKREGFDESSIRDLVRGQIAYPVEDTVTGAPGMPANLVEGEEAEAVAAYVAQVAANEEAIAAAQAEGGGGGVDEGETDGKAIFASAGCGACHVLSDAGSTGAVGPNLDESQPSVELAVDRVRNGEGAMPPFEGRLTDEQIQAVAEYVAESAGGR
jgi:cbb3-type cytochrome c oxidase subunit III